MVNICTKIIYYNYLYNNCYNNNNYYYETANMKYSIIITWLNTSFCLAQHSLNIMTQVGQIISIIQTLKCQMYIPYSG